jgi:NAD(P)-dependent dehydrogenase (short-subunit alcohol dehydrogenase family)
MKAIVITGASTGIGAVCAEYLAGRGYHIFAGVRKAADGDRLRERIPQNLTPLMMDVTQAETLQAAAQAVQEIVGEAGLFALINNAGVAYPGPLEFVPAAEIDQHFAVNVRGVILTTQAFLPLLRQGQGRILQMSSMGGKSAIPYFGTYCASKFALEGLSDSLRLELKPWGIKVIVLQPGAIETPIWAKAAGGEGVMFQGYPPAAQALYGPAMHYLSKVIPKMKGLPPERVAQVAEKALTARRPKARYVLDTTSRIRALLELLPSSWRDALIAKVMKTG